MEERPLAEPCRRARQAFSSSLNAILFLFPDGSFATRIRQRGSRLGRDAGSSERLRVSPVILMSPAADCSLGGNGGHAAAVASIPAGGALAVAVVGPCCLLPVVHQSIGGSCVACVPVSERTSFVLSAGGLLATGAKPP